MADNTDPSSPGKDSTTAFNANETKIITAIMQNLTSDIQFDAEKVAAELGYANAISLRARWNSIKRTKINITGASSPSGGVTKTTPGKKTKAAAKKGKAEADGGDDDGASPKPKGKKGGKAKGKVAVKSEEDEQAVESVEGANGIAIGNLVAEFEGEE